MRYPFILAISLLYISGNYPAETQAIPVADVNSDSTRTYIKTAWYERSFNDTALPAKNLPNDFIILVDPVHKAQNFISILEDYYRTQSKDPDTTFYSLLDIDGWNKLPAHEKMEKIKKEMISSGQIADVIHRNNNLGQNQVWVINNTNDPVSVQTQDGSYICILQALTKSGQWHSIQTWNYSRCGNSYYKKVLQPKTASSFVTMLPGDGAFETRLRFKLLGTDRFYYSNEFTGKINTSDFVEKETKFNTMGWSYSECVLDSATSL